jgi:uncharacterized protein YllA (UPF0747 family)
VSRNGFTLIDTRSEKLLDRYGLKLADLFHGEEVLRERIASKLVPGGLDDQFQSATEATTTALESLRRAVSAIDPTLEAALDKSKAKILYQLAKNRAKVARGVLRRDERASVDAAWLYNSLYPQKHLQERLYSIVPFLAQYGVDLVDRLYANVHMDCPDHVLLPIN